MIGQQKYQTVFVSGVSSGIGLGLAQYFLEHGCTVYGISRRTPTALSGYSKFHFHAVDLLVAEEIEPRLAKLIPTDASIDLVVLNAGILGQFGDLRDADLTDLQNTMWVNVWANKLLLDTLLKRGSIPEQVVAISSGASVNGNRGWSGYSISKAALNMLVKLVAAENRDVHFCALAPGLVDTAMQDELCGREADERFPALEFLRSKRHTPEMPDINQAAIILAKAFEELPESVASGEYADIRNLGSSSTG